MIRDIRDTRARSLSNSFNMDLGKRRRGPSMFRTDLGRRSAWNEEALRDLEKRRRAMFRSDLSS